MDNWNAIFLYLLGVNSIAFLFMGVDKQKAKQQHYRIPERTLWMLAILGGALGIWFGMKVFRHKTKHKRFVIGVPMLFISHCVLIVYLIWALRV
ncbi:MULTISPECIES: DUF1294 domain-containing protein [Virgibacillus]|uniref:Membrane protein n=1 Tax=Virgibacillus pantothenticus TaxID=1473 RepID=A0A0L0QQ57_VIRPA|nr:MULTISPECIES: DUF1294 domain-containing protein [Virgibacillus]API90803.1 hypothetical protein BKP57_02400 [Virgibacillus sp. 6R]KNE20750.1 membrane protein [Virgibacillus pantothenticus]MBS7426767.1 DUF1294 domain-containing protein [Virgibacillus sp. 19R1-5]MBU8566094.1 DUF1294 domain-containing protein [Virgibacillus pantothenticus]MBU8600610.1 DUF1294 domain-containing protein [Virgibacillus pantothenticus]